jgi:NADPH:quinone reductase
LINIVRKEEQVKLL